MLTTRQIFYVSLILIISKCENTQKGAYWKLRDLQYQQFRPKYSNTQSKFNFLNEPYGLYYRNKREPKNGQNSFANIRQRLNEEKFPKKDELMVLDASPRMEINYTGLPRHPSDTQYGGINTEQNYNRENDKMRLLYAYRNSQPEISYSLPGTECNFERTCTWKWKNDSDGGFFVTRANKTHGTEDGPEFDADNKSSGHFLLLRLKPTTRELHVTSPLFSPSADTCKIQVWIYQDGMVNGMIRIVAETENRTQWLVSQIHGDSNRRWIKYNKAVGKISQDFHIILEIVPVQRSAKSALIAFDNIKLIECFPESDSINACTPFQYRCGQTNVCINNTRICDINQDCELGDDETQNCEKIPYGARCNFEQDWCGWQNVEGKVLQWARHNGSTPTNRTGPSFDHTYQNATGKYMYVNMAAMGKEVVFASIATLRSIVFNPPPKVHGNSSSRYYNSCTIRFFLHQYGSHKSGLMLQVTEIRPKENVSSEILWSYNDYGDTWVRKTVILPNITYKYYLHFDARRGIRYMGDVAIDDFSMSPECFGLNIPQSELNTYNYWNPAIEKALGNAPYNDFENETYYEITTCGVKGRDGPLQDNCTAAYKNTSVNVKVMHAPGLNGIQKWTAPHEGYYTFILVGASGGKGSGGMGSSRGAMVRTVMELSKGQEVLLLVGQEGTSACVKSLGHQSNSSCKSLRNDDSKDLTGVRGVLRMEVADGGGGGGGATYVFVFNRTKHPIPLAVAAGGGGLGLGRFIDNGDQHGQAINMSRPAVTGQMYGTKSAGAGGGWEMFHGKVAYGHEGLMGLSLVEGGTGGSACYDSIDRRGDGGFGGGGGGCTAGGGGGGYAGGNAWSTNSTNGEGGYSFLDPSRTIPSLSEARSGYHAGPGFVLIIPAIPGCGCNYRCLALDTRRSQVACICPKDWKLDGDGKTCILLDAPDTFSDWLIVVLFLMLISLMAAFGFVCVLLYNRYQHRTVGMVRRKMMSGADLQLNRLPAASNSMLTEYNPNYEFAGVTYTLKDLKDIPRNQLQLQKALGQGAFGEVYQGFYRQRSGDAVEMPVAVKTLPALSTHEAEVDFLMEALIMSKFNHPNIVHFIGVCFDKHPRFIVLELLAGGDLKNFLRESRPKPDKSGSLTMKDLIMIAIDVAKGCNYMEENRFIHRDIAARNCLLTTKGPGRVVKIADFGMSRDIYRSDYYRKGGRAMLPIKWMPPEAFLDGIFTAKTDVWSFGVLLWEIMSMGYMPYTGCANRQVMQLVTSGGRLEPPTNCPGPIYGIMTQCWHPDPDQRPNFKLILERLGYCGQDPEVLKAPLPIFNRAPSQEKDVTIMRPGTHDHCIEVSKAAADYLIPTSIGPNTIGSTSSVDRLIPDSSDSWETSFVIPHSKSTQPLLPEPEYIDEVATSSVEKLLVPDAPKVENVSPLSLPSSILTNLPTKAKVDIPTLRAGVSLDAGALAKQTMSPPNKKSYANINPEDLKMANGVLQNGPCNLTNDGVFRSAGKTPNGTLITDSINC
ncbi:hypothetical protein RI129_010600 [Pyrocoelia pectoralis]|uniref:Tyrosine-protein kinase receptor n=1 Tax=Pyrocoelia pectoralis TaxID=417401 RepID=A0AAN7V4G3_9COLE